MGYSGIVITDHFFNGNTAVDRRLPWKEAVEAFAEGWRDAKSVGDDLGLDVFFGWEYASSGMEYLTYGFDVEWLMDNPWVMEVHVDDYLREIRRQGGFAVHAHPFRKAAWIPSIKLTPELYEGVEVINASMPLDINHHASVYADENNLCRIGASDKHGTYEENTCAMHFEERPRDVHTMIDYIRKGRYTIG
jgi:hypothetical protein